VTSETGAKIRNRIVAERTVETGVHSKGRGGKQDRVFIRIGPRSILVADVGAAPLFSMKTCRSHNFESLLASMRATISGSNWRNYAHRPIWEIGFRRLRAPLPNEKVQREGVGCQ
jgi:hypothetical protein